MVYIYQSQRILGVSLECWSRMLLLKMCRFHLKYVKSYLATTRQISLRMKLLDIQRKTELREPLKNEAGALIKPYLQLISSQFLS